MKRWFKYAFGKDYCRLYAHRDDQEARRMLELFRRSTRIEPPARTLDLGCGIGRHLLHLALLGYQVTGLDLSEPLLREARSAACGRRPDLIRAEMLHLPFADGSFDAVLNLFTTFGYYPEDRENWRVAREMARVLRPGGALFFDYLNRNGLQLEFEKFSARTDGDGSRIEERRWISADGRRIEKETLICCPGGTQRKLFESVRMFSRAELHAHFEKLGLHCAAECGDYQGGAWSETSPRLIMALKKL